MYAILGMKEEAIAQLPKELKTFTLDPYHQLTSFPLWENLREKQGFQTMVDQEKAIYEARQKKYRL